MGLEAEKRDEASARLIAAGRALLAGGDARFSLTKLCSEAGVTLEEFRASFTSKAALLQQLMEQPKPEPAPQADPLLERRLRVFERALGALEEKSEKRDREYRQAIARLEERLAALSGTQLKLDVAAAAERAVEAAPQPAEDKQTEPEPEAEKEDGGFQADALEAAIAAAVEPDPLALAPLEPMGPPAKADPDFLEAGRRAALAHGRALAQAPTRRRIPTRFLLASALAVVTLLFCAIVTFGHTDYLLYSDPPANKMHKWTEKGGDEIFMAPSGFAGADPGRIYREAGSNGIHYRDGHIIYADSGHRTVVRMDLKTRQKEVLASQFEGKRLNSPNDIAITKKGVIFFTDPPYGLNDTLKSPARELDFQGVFRIGLDGKLSLVDRDGGMPNGIGISPDGKFLYTSDTGGGKRQMYDLTADDQAINRRLFGEGDAGGDGFKVAATGHLFASGRGGMIIYNPAGKKIGMIVPAGGPISNCFFTDEGYLYLSNGHSMGRIKVKVKGVP